jgi:hypothetical protein
MQIHAVGTHIEANRLYKFRQCLISYRRALMKAFLLACVAAGVLAAIAFGVLSTVQEPVQQAFATSGVRL